MRDDRYYLRKTFKLAKRGQGFVSPNPLVGAVIVKDGRVVSSGYHQRSGFAHAEIEALRKIDKRICSGAVLFVNLEPCVHWAKTPPCVDAIIASGIKG